MAPCGIVMAFAAFRIAFADVILLQVSASMDKVIDVENISRNMSDNVDEEQRRPPRFPGDFKWSDSGPIRGWRCVQVVEPNDPHSWLDNYFCQHPETQDVGLQWSYAGPIRGKKCVRILEETNPPEHSWRDNYLCTSHRAPNMIWSSAGPRGACVRWREPADPYSWHDNYLCAA